METLNAIGGWLKTSIWGIVILGAIGSIVAVAALNCGAWFIASFLPRRIWLMQVAMRTRQFRTVHFLSKIERDPARLCIYGLYRLVLFSFFLALMGISGVAAVVGEMVDCSYYEWLLWITVFAASLYKVFMHTLRPSWDAEVLLGALLRESDERAKEHRQLLLNPPAARTSADNTTESS